MKLVSSILGGLAGAIAVTLLHELIRKNFDEAPRLDKLGEESAAKLIELSGNSAPPEKQLYKPALTADILSNAFYYGFATSRGKRPIISGLIAGATAGMGAVKLPGKMGLNPDHTAGSPEKKAITIGLYTVGGLLAAVIAKAFSRSRETDDIIA